MMTKMLLVAFLTVPLQALLLPAAQPPKRSSGSEDLFETQPEDFFELHRDYSANNNQREIAVSNLALQEAGYCPDGALIQDCREQASFKLSAFAKYVPKWPKSWMDKVTKTRTESSNVGNRKYRFSFMGSSTNHKFREWLLPFVTSKFDERDYLAFTDSPGKHYKPLGSFDESRNMTGKAGHGYRPKSNRGAGVPWEVLTYFDDHYYAVMGNSSFALCPGGDGPYSMRLYEAAAARAIPVINSVKTDMREPGGYQHKIGYKYITIGEQQEELVYDESIAEHNFRLFVKYQTFVEGDNVP